MESTRVFVAKFKVSGIPDSAGLRIHSIEPWGVYLSSVNPQVAQKCFEMLLISMVGKRELLGLLQGEGIILEQTLDWDKFLLKGEGEASLRAIGIAEVEERQKEAVPALSDIFRDLSVEGWRDPNGREFVVARDRSDQVDGWLLDAITKDLDEGANLPKSPRSERAH